MDEQRYEGQSELEETPSQPVKATDSYWLETDKDIFLLFVDNEQRAEVDLSFMNSGEITHGDAREGFVLPDSMVMMDVIEKRLGVEKVDRVIGKDGRPAPELRDELERKAAEETRQPYASANEAAWMLKYADEALRRADAAKEIGDEGREALRLLTSAQQDGDFFMEWTPKARESVREAHRLLGAAAGRLFDERDEATFYCSLAIAALDRSAELDPPEYEEHPDNGETYWRSRKRGYELHVDGYHRATAYHDNSYKIEGSEIGRRALPDSQLNIEIVEAKLGLTRIEDFRDADGRRVSPLSNPRAALEPQANDVRGNEEARPSPAGDPSRKAAIEKAARQEADGRNQERDRDRD